VQEIRFQKEEGCFYVPFTLHRTGHVGLISVLVFDMCRAMKVFKKQRPPHNLSCASFGRSEGKIMNHQFNILDFESAECGIEAEVSGRREGGLFIPFSLSNKHRFLVIIFLNDISGCRYRF